MRLFAWNGRFARTVFRDGRAASCKQQERLYKPLQADHTDTPQALNPKSLVSTTNKLQQFVAEVERMECLTLRPCDVPVIVEIGAAAFLP